MTRLDQLIKCASDSEWDKFQDVSPNGSVYSTTSYLEGLNINHDKLFYYVDNKLMAAALIIDPENVFKSAMYHGIYLTKLDYKQHSLISRNHVILTGLLEKLYESYKELNFSFHYSFSDLRPVQWLNYHKKDEAKFNLLLKYTGIIDLTEYDSFSSYMKSIRTLRKREYKKAVSSQLKIIDSKDVDEFINLYQLTFDRQEIELDSHTINNVRNIVRNSLDKNIGRLAFCHDENNLHSAMLTLYDNNSSYYQFGATDPKFRASGGSTFLMLNNIEHSFNNHRKIFDMVGMNSPNRGDYKLSFNALPKPYYYATLKNL